MKYLPLVFPSHLPHAKWMKKTKLIPIYFAFPLVFLRLSLQFLYALLLIEYKLLS